MMLGKGRNKLPRGELLALGVLVLPIESLLLGHLIVEDNTMLANQPIQPLVYAVFKEGNGNCTQASLLNIIPPARQCLA